MLTTAPRLRIRRPSPTAAEFTVTTRPPPTLSLRVLGALLLVLRALLALAALLLLLLLHARWAAGPLAPSPSPSPSPAPPLVARALDALHRSPPRARLARLAAAVPLAALVPAAAAVLYLVALRLHASESLLVLRGLGVQTSESPRTYLARPATRFIPTEKIQDILVNEAFLGLEVRYYLVVVVEGEDDVVVVFPGLLPSRSIVETVWRGARECLDEGRAEDKAAQTA